ncbi:2 lactate dehydrogenase [Cenarchaeum symbiosum A]|uniref:2 lactate dehydrogenase n=1 Tax=Cenarchaeum symbiosum (strain A) TaxID=414004 RepID=A0RUD3_CENSY|nr:2 lactate dehydrogenase [Cenarchaeum symbiosum A]
MLPQLMQHANSSMSGSICLGLHTNLINGFRSDSYVRKRILLTRRLQDFAQARLGRRYDLEVYSGRVPMPRRALIRAISGAHALVCFPYDVIDAGVMDAAPDLETIATYSVGYDHIDVAHARGRGITVGYTPDVLTDATADLTMALMLDLLRRVTEGDRIIRAGRWRQIYGADDYLGTDVGGKTLGILGMGRIGSRVAKRAAAFGMKVIYHSRSSTGPGTRVTLGRLLERSDVLSIHVPHTPDTHEMMDMSRLRKMKRSAYLINTSRGRVVHEKDLAAALRQGIIAGAALDVFHSEPVGPANPLVKMQNVVLAPHIGSSTDGTRRKMAELTVKNLELGLSGREPAYSVK